MCAARPKRYALLVGIDLYLNDGSRNASSHRELSLHHLRGCKNDIEAIYKFLRDEYEFENISILTSSFSVSSSQELAAVCPLEPPDCLPTFANIKAEFDKIYDGAAAGDFFFFHYSGHGALLQRQKNSPKANLLDPSLITVDFCCGQPAVRGWQLNQWLKKLNEKGIKVVVTLDSCYSGGSWRSTDDYKSLRTPDDWSSVPNLPIDYQAVADLDHTMELTHRNAELERSWAINPKSFTLIAACGEKEKAAEKIVNGKVHGAFTWELLDYLRHSGNRSREGERGVNVTYRMISDQLNIRLKDQTPAVYGRDRLLFFGNYEPFSAAPIMTQVQDNKVIIPAGKAHGVNVGTEFTVFSEIFVGVSFSVDAVEEFQCSAIITDELSLLLKQYHQTVILSRWNLEEKEILRLYVDPAFGSSFRSELQRRLEKRIVSPIELLETTKDHMDVLKLDKLVEDAAIIRAPMWLTGSDDTVRPLKLNSSNPNELAAEAALALVHLVRFRQILLLGQQRWPKPPFNVTIMAVNGSMTNPHPLNQKFRFAFENKSDEDLHISVVVFSPEFSVEQLYPTRDHSQTIGRRQKKIFNFSMALPNGPEWVQKSLCRKIRRDIVRTLVTRDRNVSWKALEIPNIWDANATTLCKKLSSTRNGSTVAGQGVDWWSHDEEIFTGSVECS
ncbi:caspase domain-containing protein [Trichoderma afarasin]